MASVEQYAVFGHPVAHSLSPRIHGWFAAETGQSMTYRPIEAPLDGFAAAARAFFAEGGRGANVTVPFKAEACAFADTVTAPAARAGAANTLRREPDGRISAFNTDGIGLVRDLTDHLGATLPGRVVVLLGAGGAAAGVIEPLLAAGVARVVIGNRTRSRAVALADLFAGCGRVSAEGLEALPPADILVNATAASIHGAVPELAQGLVHEATLAYDMMYADRPSPFMLACDRRGAWRSADGLGMLIEQAAEAFFIWRGLRPDTASVRKRLRPHGLARSPEHS